VRDNVVQIFKGLGRQPWFVRLVSPNGATLSISEGYYSKWNAKRAANRMFAGLEIRVIQPQQAEGELEDAQATKGTGSSG